MDNRRDRGEQQKKSKSMIVGRPEEDHFLAPEEDASGVEKACLSVSSSGAP
jgi:hypothetical protein